jgi:hypothetical protein
MRQIRDADDHRAATYADRTWHPAYYNARCSIASTQMARRPLARFVVAELASPLRRDQTLVVLNNGKVGPRITAQARLTTIKVGT